MQLFLFQIIAKNNFSTIYLLGFQNLDSFRLFFFTLLFVVYCMTQIGNILIITLVSYSKNLQCPMYFFLTQLSLTDLLLTNDIVPGMLHIVINNGAMLSLNGCLTQFFLFSASESAECLLLTVMSYDRYLAICNPLHYTCVMNSIFCLQLVLVSWLLSFIITIVITLGISQLQFCGPNIIENFFCDFYPILQLSCSDISIIQMISTILCFPVILFPLILIILSYIYIISVLSKISTVSGRRRSFSTCSSHLTVVSIFYGTLIAMYLLPKKKNSFIDSKILSMLYTVFAPCLNPLIYGLRNNDIKESLLKVISNFSGNLILK